MVDSSFRTEGALRVDLAKGELSGGKGRLVALPTATFLALARAVEATSESGVALYAAGREWGEGIGREVADDIAAATGKPVREASPATVIDHLSGRLASLGWGTLSIELWGEGLVFVLGNAPGDGAEPARHLFAGFFAGVAGGLGGTPLAGAAVGPGTELRVLVGNSSAIKAARRWHESGVGLGAIIDRLRAGDHHREAGA